MSKTRMDVARRSPREIALALLIVAAMAVCAGRPTPAYAGANLDLDAFAGKVVLIDFWASWCSPCRQSFPWMNDMQAKYADDGLVIVAVNVDNDPVAAAQFLAEAPASFRIHYDDEKTLVRQFDVIAMPSSFLVGRDGQIVDRQLGFKSRHKAAYEAAIRAALMQE